MLWEIQKNIFEKNYQENLIESLKFHNQSYDLTNEQVPNRKCATIHMGSVEFVSEYSPNITLNNYQCSNYYPYYSSYMLNNLYMLINLDLLNESCFDIFESDKLFIRPNSGNKIFTGNWIGKDNLPLHLKTIFDLPGNNKIPPNELILVAPYKEILSEYRVLMYKDHVLDYSLYLGNDLEHTLDTTIISFANEVAKVSSFYPNDYYVIDICIEKNKNENKPSVVEINNMFSASWYDCNYKEIIGFIIENPPESYFI